MLVILLIVAAAGLMGYAVFTHYQETSPTLSVPKRVWASVVAGAAAAGAAIMSMIHNATAP